MTREPSTTCYLRGVSSTEFLLAADFLANFLSLQISDRMSLDHRLETFVKQQLRLIELERKNEIDETARLQSSLKMTELERRGLCLGRLRVVDDSVGFGGRTLLVLQLADGKYLPEHRFHSNDLVLVRTHDKEGDGGRGDATRGERGVVSQVKPDRISVILDDVAEADLSGMIRIDRVANDVTFQRLRRAVERLDQRDPGPAKRLRDVLFGLRDAKPIEPATELPETCHRVLDDSQERAVRFALGATELAMIHGPPGTGKTTTLVELILQAVSLGEKVLACAASNVAVDHLVGASSSCRRRRRSSRPSRAPAPGGCGALAGESRRRFRRHPGREFDQARARQPAPPP